MTSRLKNGVHTYSIAIEYLDEYEFIKTQNIFETYDDSVEVWYEDVQRLPFLKTLIHPDKLDSLAIGDLDFILLRRSEF